MKRTFRILCPIALFFIFSLPGFGADTASGGADVVSGGVVIREASGFSDDFIGLSTEAFGSLAPGATIGKTNIDSVYTVVTFGKRSLLPGLPLRARVGLGWWPDRPVSVLGGGEVALYEVLSFSQGRAFGLYAFVDAMCDFCSDGPSFRAVASIVGLIPTSLIGGLAVGAGMDSSGNVVFLLKYLTGVYPLR